MYTCCTQIELLQNDSDITFKINKVIQYNRISNFPKSFIYADWRSRV